jgi:hypothetical protein
VERGGRREHSLDAQERSETYEDAPCETLTRKFIIIIICRNLDRECGGMTSWYKVSWQLGISGSIVSGYGLDDRAIEVRSPAEARGFFLYPLYPDRLWGPPSLLSNGYWGSFPGVKRGRSVTLTTHLYLVPRSWMSRSCTSSPPAPHRCVVGLLYLLLTMGDASRQCVSFIYFSLQFIYRRFFGNSGWVASNEGMGSEWGIRKDLEGSGRGLIWRIITAFGGTEKNTKTCQDTRFPDENFNPWPPEHWVGVSTTGLQRCGAVIFINSLLLFHTWILCSVMLLCCKFMYGSSRLFTFLIYLLVSMIYRYPSFHIRTHLFFHNPVNFKYLHAYRDYFNFQ